MSVKVENLIDLDRLTQYDGLIKNNIKEHSDIQATDTVSGHVKVDTGLSDTSTNPVQNKVVKNALDGKVPVIRTVNGKALSSNISLSASDIGADPSGSSNSALSSAKSYTDTQVSAVNSALTSHVGNTSNPHNVTKSQVGLGNVENKSSATIRDELTKANVTKALGYTPPTTNTTYGVATSSTLGLIKSGTDITVDSSGNVSVNDNSHNHTISNVSGLQSALDAKATKTTLTNQDLNSVVVPGFYNAGGGNTVTNKPNGVDHFGLIVIHRASGSYYTQILFNDTSSYRRFCVNGNWGGWTQDKLTDTDTWRGIQNNLTSTSTTDSLSANQGRLLANGSARDDTKLPLGGGEMLGTIKFNSDSLPSKTLEFICGIDAFASGGEMGWQSKSAFLSDYSKIGHTHDDRYYTESEIDTKLNAKLNTSLKGTANGLAELDSTGRVPSSQLPSYVDDVIEGYLYNSKFYKEPAHTTEITGETGKIYVDLTSNKTYRWSGSAFVVISETLALGETSTTAYRGDRGKIAYDHSQTAHAPSNAEVNQNAFSNVIVGSTTIAADSKTDTLTLVAGSNVTITPDATNDKITISSANTDTKVTQTAVGASGYTNWRPLVWGASNSGTEGFTPTTTTDGVFTADTLSCQPSTGTIRANVFKGNLSGIANTAIKLQTARTINGTSFDGSANITTANWGTARNIKVGDTNKSINGSTDYSWTSSEIGYRHEWSCTITCATWSRLCYVSYAISTVGAKYILNISATRGDVVYNDTFLITSHHSSRGSIIKLGGSKYSEGHQIRVLADSNGNSYVELYDALRDATSSTTQTVHCRLIPIFCGAITKYTSFTSGTTLPTNFSVAHSLTINNTNIQANLSGNADTSSKWLTPRTLSLTGAVTGSVSIDGSSDMTLLTTVNHTHNYAGSASAGGAANYLTVQHGDEINFKGMQSTGTVYFNFRNPETGSHSGNTNLTLYKFCNRNGGTSGVTLTADSFTGNSETTSRLKTARTISLTGSVTGSGTFDGSGDLTISTTTNHTHNYLPLSGGILTGLLTLKGDMYEDSYTGALNANNSNIYGINSLIFADLSDSTGEGIQFYRDSSHVDSLWANNGVLYFSPNRPLGGSVTNYSIYHSGNLTKSVLGLGNVENKSSETIRSEITSANVTTALGFTPANSNHVHTSLKSNTDNRSTDTTPNDYNSVLKISGLKQNSVIGITGHGTYSGVLGMRPWSERSGGNSHEFALTQDGEIFHRHGETTSWNSWRQIAFTSSNVASASKLENARTISLTGSVTGSGSFDGSGNLSITTTTNHTHSYLPLSGGTLTGPLKVNSTIFGYNFTNNHNAPAFIFDKPGSNYTGIGCNGTSDTIYFGAVNSDFSWNTSYKQIWKFNGSVIADSFNGNATSATKATQDASGNVITSKYVAVDTTQTISGTKTFSNPVNITNTNTSINMVSGALKVSGGVGVSGQISANTLSIGDGVRLEYSASTQTLNFIFEDTSSSQVLTTASDIELTNTSNDILITS